MPETEIELASAIENLRAELQVAIKKGEGQPLRFTIPEIELELKCLLKKEGAGGIGVKFWVINSEVKGTIANEIVQIIKLKLRPVGKDGGEVLVSDVDDY